MAKLLLILLFALSSAQASRLADWCAKQGFPILANSAGEGWGKFSDAYYKELVGLMAARGPRTSEEVALDARRAEQTDRGAALRTLKNDPSLRAAAAYFVTMKLRDARFGSNPPADLETLQALEKDPRSALPEHLRDISSLVGMVRGMLPLPSHVAGDPRLIDPALVAAWKGQSSPEVVRESVRRQLETRGRDGIIDTLVGLDPVALKEEDIAKHGDERHGLESTWMKTDHTYYGSSYHSFKAYGEALNIPKGGKFVDLGAGPFRAGVYFGAARPDVEVVGYELFQTRVDAGQRVVDRMGIGNRARIFQKDLSKPNLQLESADGYIMMNPFPRDTAKNILTDLGRVARETRKPFRVLIFDAAKESLEAAGEFPWLRPVPAARRSAGDESRYGFYVYEVDPTKF